MERAELVVCGLQGQSGAELRLSAGTFEEDDHVAGYGKRHGAAEILFHQRTGDPWWREKAEDYSRPLEPRQHDRDVHDLGFIFMSTYFRWHQATAEALSE